MSAAKPGHVAARRRLEAAIDRLAGLYEHGHALIAGVPENLLNEAADEIVAARARLAELAQPRPAEAELHAAAVERFGALVDAVVDRIAESGSLLDVLEIVGDACNACDHVDDDLIERWGRARTAAARPAAALAAPPPLRAEAVAALLALPGLWRAVGCHPNCMNHPELSTSHHPDCARPLVRELRAALRPLGLEPEGAGNQKEEVSR